MILEQVVVLFRLDGVVDTHWLLNRGRACMWGFIFNAKSPNGNWWG